MPCGGPSLKNPARVRAWGPFCSIYLRVCPPPLCHALDHRSPKPKRGLIPQAGGSRLLSSRPAGSLLCPPERQFQKELVYSRAWAAITWDGQRAAHEGFSNRQKQLPDVLPSWTETSGVPRLLPDPGRPRVLWPHVRPHSVLALSLLTWAISLDIRTLTAYSSGIFSLGLPYSWSTVTFPGVLHLESVDSETCPPPPP